MVTQLVRRAESAGFKAIVLTADSPVVGRREAGIKNRLTIIGKFQRDQFFFNKKLYKLTNLLLVCLMGFMQIYIATIREIEEF